VSDSSATEKTAAQTAAKSKKTGGDAASSTRKKTTSRSKKSAAPTGKRRKKTQEVKTTDLKKDVVRKTKSIKRAERPTPSTPPPPVAEPVSEEIYAPDLEDDEYSSEEYDQMMAMYDETMGDIKEGVIVKGRVMGVTRDDVIVDVGFKSEGVIPLHEFPQPVNISVGEELEVFLDAVEDQNGQLLLSKQKADFLRVWDHIREAYEQGALVDGTLEKRIKGGMVVDLFGVDAFLPGSQIALRQVPDFDSLIGQTMKMKIIKLNKSRRNIVVSRRVVLEEERERMRTELLSEIEVGQVRKGIVKNITDFGVFIDLGGVDGLLHITDMSWGRIRHPSEMVAIGDEISIKILDYDDKTSRISLGLKQLTPYPWDNIEEKYPVGERVKGKIVSITDYGAFVELEKGVEGLIHVSEMSWRQHVRHPSRFVQIGDNVEAIVLNVDKEHQKISLGIKQLEPDPWSTIETKYQLGSRHEGRVRNITAFGAFVELEEGIDGLVHISDLSWTRRIQHPSEVIKKNDKVEIVVLAIDKENRKISLGHKQLIADPWPTFHERFRAGKEMNGKIIRLLERGVVVELEGEVEGFVPLNQLGKRDLEKPEEAFAVNDELKLKIIEFDPTNKRIVLSVDAYYRDKERSDLDEFLAKHPTRSMTVGEAASQTPEAPADKTAKPTEAPADDSAKPAEPAETPADDSAKPAEATEAPADESAKPAEATETPADESAKPAEATEATADESAKPAEATEAPADESAKPAEATETPADESAKPAEAAEATEAAKEEPPAEPEPQPEETAVSEPAPAEAEEPPPSTEAGASEEEKKPE